MFCQVAPASVDLKTLLMELKPENVTYTSSSLAGLVVIYVINKPGIPVSVVNVFPSTER